MLLEEVSPDKSTAQRSQTTGKLLVTMPKVKQVMRSAKSAVESSNRKRAETKRVLEKKEYDLTSSSATNTGCLLEVDPTLKSKTAELANIVGPTAAAGGPCRKKEESFTNKQELPLSSDFVDDPDVPPLI